MSLPGGRRQYGECRFPRVSGDEPTTYKLIQKYAAFSPRERG